MATGTKPLDFGAFPGASDAFVDVTGQAGIIAGSLVEAWLLPIATADHTADEHRLESIKVDAGNITPGTGFTIYGLNTSQINEPLMEVFNVRGGAGTMRPGRVHGEGTRIYGVWTVAWVWI